MAAHSPPPPHLPRAIPPSPTLRTTPPPRSAAGALPAPGRRRPIARRRTHEAARGPNKEEDTVRDWNRPTPPPIGRTACRNSPDPNPTPSLRPHGVPHPGCRKQRSRSEEIKGVPIETRPWPQLSTCGHVIWALPYFGFRCCFSDRKWPKRI